MSKEDDEITNKYLCYCPCYTLKGNLISHYAKNDEGYITIKYFNYLSFIKNFYTFLQLKKTKLIFSKYFYLNYIQTFMKKKFLLYILPVLFKYSIFYIIFSFNFIKKSLESFFLKTIFLDF
jgi:hypothetical protein